MLTNTWTRSRVVTAAAGIAVIAASSAALSAPSASSLPRGCSTTGVVAYDTGGRTVGGSSAPASCAGYTGFGGAESHIRLAPDGTGVQEPGVIPLGVPRHMHAGVAACPIPANARAPWDAST